MKKSVDVRKWITKRNVLRLLVVAAIYMGLVMTTVTVLLSCVWVIKQTTYGLWCVLILCLLIGCTLFFRLGWEGQKRPHALIS